ncbi:fibronectin type III domain-containing protein [Micromonospora sp. GCM10011541]|uniref:fibronectin type III domain-containing protein n=1 Tax=Micromonospora sp. GCM10011541 TaxID=3317336 RepID=UPI003615DD53
MATTWGSTEAHLQVGIDCWTSTPTSTSTVVKVYLRVYVKMPDNWEFGDNQSYKVTGTGGGSGTFYNDLSSAGQTKLIYSHDMNAAIDYDGGPTYTWTASISGMYNGGTPSHTRSITLPKRPATVPAAPGTPTAGSITATGATLTWSTPSSNGASLDRNAGQVAKDSAFTNLVTSWDAAGWATSRAITGLPKGTPLYARVRTHNSVGWSAYSGARTFTTGTTAPSAPGTPSVSSISATTASVSWSTPSDSGGAAITSYEIQRSTDSSFTSPTTATDSTSPTSLSGLLPGTTYYLRARAVSSAGAGAWSSTASFTTLSGVKVGTGTEWRDAIVWVGDGSRWVMTQVKVGNGTAWR